MFVDAYYPDSPDPKVRDFVAGFREVTGAEPSLWEAQAFDTAGMVKWLLAADRPLDRTAFRDSLLKVRGFDGVTGRMSFAPTGEVQKKLMVLTIQERAIRLWEPSEAAPEG